MLLFLISSHTRILVTEIEIDYISISTDSTKSVLSEMFILRDFKKNEEQY